MKRFLINKPAVKLSLLFTTVVGLSIWVGSNPILFQYGKSLVPVTTSAITPNNSSQQIQAQVYWLQHIRFHTAASINDCRSKVTISQTQREFEQYDSQRY
jgi:hypothetical protein